MLRLALAFVFGASAVFFMDPGRVTYSGLQAQVPFGTAIKVTPDPSNIWSFHQEVTVQARSTVKIPVLVDFDNNGRMDTEARYARILVTDLQVAAQVGSSLSNLAGARLVDGQGVRWDFWPDGPNSQHLQTPLALPIDSPLFVELRTGPNVSASVVVHLIGRLVTM